MAQLRLSRLELQVMETMWQHVSKYWEFLPPDEKQLDQIAARILATLVYDNFSSTAPLSGGIGEVAIHPGEIYIFATPRQYLAVGDVVNVNEKLFIVLTPACDLILRKSGKASASVVLLAEFESLKEFAGEVRISPKPSACFRAQRRKTATRARRTSNE